MKRDKQGGKPSAKQNAKPGAKKNAKPDSTKSAKPASRVRTVANKLVRVQQSVGRPAPTDAKAIIQARVRAPKGDYRTIRF